MPRIRRSIAVGVLGTQSTGCSRSFFLKTYTGPRYWLRGCVPLSSSGLSCDDKPRRTSYVRAAISHLAHKRMQLGAPPCPASTMTSGHFTPLSNVWSEHGMAPTFARRGQQSTPAICVSRLRRPLGMGGVQPSNGNTNRTTRTPAPLNPAPESQKRKP